MVRMKGCLSKALSKADYLLCLFKKVGFLKIDILLSVLFSTCFQSKWFTISINLYFLRLEDKIETVAA